MSTKKTSEIDKIPEFHEKESDSKGNVIYSITCAYCGNEVRYYHTEKPEKCPHCGSTDYRKPKTETMLFRLQDQYLESRDNEVLGQMYIILCDYSKSLIKKNLPKDFTHHYGVIDEKSVDVANRLVEKYLTKPQFKVENSFAGYLSWRVKEVLWNRKTIQEESHDSLNAHIDDKDGNASEVMEFTENISDSSEAPAYLTAWKNKNQNFDNFSDWVVTEQTEQEDLENGLYNLIEKILSMVESEFGKYTKLGLLGALLLYMERGNTDESHQALNRYYRLFGTRLKDLLNRIEKSMYLFIKGE